MNWSTAEAREGLSRLVRALDDEPQVITNRGRPVAVVIDPEEYEAFLRWRARRGVTLADALDELEAACVDDDYTLEAAPRADRSDPFSGSAGGAAEFSRSAGGAAECGDE